MGNVGSGYFFERLYNAKVCVLGVPAKRIYRSSLAISTEVPHSKALTLEKVTGDIAEEVIIIVIIISFLLEWNIKKW